MRVELLRKQMSPEELLQSGHVCTTAMSLCSSMVVLPMCQKVDPEYPPLIPFPFILYLTHCTVCAPRPSLVTKGIDGLDELQTIVLNSHLHPWPARAGNADGHSIISLIVFLTP